MNNQPTRLRQASRAAARTLAVAAVMAALVAILGAGQALATLTPPDERVLERQGRLDNQAAANQADEQPKAGKPAQGPSTPVSRRFFKPEPPMDTGPRLDADEQLFPAPAPPAPASDRTGLVISLVVAALLLAAVAARTWWIHHRRPRPEPTGPLSRTGSPSHPATPSAPHQG